jgi:hypothetical protein
MTNGRTEHPPGPVPPRVPAARDPPATSHCLARSGTAEADARQ